MRAPNFPPVAWKLPLLNAMLRNCELLDRTHDLFRIVAHQPSEPHVWNQSLIPKADYVLAAAFQKGELAPLP